ncbi:MAG: MerR family transcriptional regulator [Faecalibacillus sp.]
MYTMMQACKEVNMTYEALKFYCNAGLIPNVKRDKNNRRIFDENNINWIKSLSCLKNCGMSIKDMQVYLDLCLQGQKTIPKRQEILELQKEKLINQLEEIKKSLDYIEHKQDFYQKVLNGEIEYHSYLIDTSKEV